MIPFTKIALACNDFLKDPSCICFDIFAYSIKLRPIAMADAKCLVVPSKSEEEQDRKATLDDCNYGLKWNGYW